MKNIVYVFDTIESSLMEDKEEGDPDTTLELDQLTFISMKQSTESMNGSSINTNQGSVQFPPNFAQGYSCLESSVRMHGPVW